MYARIRGSICTRHSRASHKEANAPWLVLWIQASLDMQREGRIAQLYDNTDVDDRKPLEYKMPYYFFVYYIFSFLYMVTLPT